MAVPVKDFAAEIKSKYPEYAEYDDSLLTSEILDKYPEYKQYVIFEEPAPFTEPEYPTPELPSKTERAGLQGAITKAREPVAAPEGVLPSDVAAAQEEERQRAGRQEELSGKSAVRQKIKEHMEKRKQLNALMVEREDIIKELGERTLTPEETIQSLRATAEPSETRVDVPKAANAPELRPSEKEQKKLSEERKTKEEVETVMKALTSGSPYLRSRVEQFADISSKALPLQKEILTEQKQIDEEIDRLYDSKSVIHAMNTGLESKLGKHVRAPIAGITSSALSFLNAANMATHLVTGGATNEEIEASHTEAENLAYEYTRAITQNPIESKSSFESIILEIEQMLPALLGGLTAEAVVPVPGSSLAFWSTVGAGRMYGNMLKQGNSRNVASMVAVPFGVLYGAIEKLQVGQIFGKKAVETVSKKTLMDLAQKPLKKVMGENIRRYGANWLRETSEEGFQAVTEGVALELANQLEGKSSLSKKQIYNNLKTAFLQAMAESYKSLGVLGLIGLGRGLGKDVVLRKAGKSIVEESVTEAKTNKILDAIGELDRQDLTKNIESPDQVAGKAQAASAAKQEISPTETSGAAPGVAEIESGLQKETVAPKTMEERRREARRDLETVKGEILNSYVEKGIYSADEINDPKIQAAAEAAADRASRNPVTGFPAKPHEISDINELMKQKTEDDELLVVQMDVDYFKAFNDTYGHPFGDEVLRKIVSAVSKMFDYMGAKTYHKSGDEMSAIRLIKKDKFKSFADSMVPLIDSMSKHVKIELPNGKVVPASITFALSNDNMRSEELLASVKGKYKNYKNGLAVDESLGKMYNITSREGIDRNQLYSAAGLKGRGLSGEQIETEYGVKPAGVEAGVAVREEAVRGPESVVPGEPAAIVKEKPELERDVSEAPIAEKPLEDSAPFKKEKISGREEASLDELEAIAITEGAETLKKIDKDKTKTLHIHFTTEKTSRGKVVPLAENEVAFLKIKGNDLHVFINSRASPENVRRAITHELISHYGTSKVLDSDPAIKKQLKKLMDQDKESVATLRREYKEQLEEAKNPEEYLFNEWAAHKMDEHIKRKDSNGIARKVYELMKSFFIRLGRKFGRQFKDIDEILGYISTQMTKVKASKPSKGDDVLFAKEIDPEAERTPVPEIPLEAQQAVNEFGIKLTAEINKLKRDPKNNELSNHEIAVLALKNIESAESQSEYTPPKDLSKEKKISGFDRKFKWMQAATQMLGRISSQDIRDTFMEYFIDKGYRAVKALRKVKGGKQVIMKFRAALGASNYAKVKTEQAINAIYTYLPQSGGYDYKQTLDEYLLAKRIGEIDKIVRNRQAQEETEGQLDLFLSEEDMRNLHTYRKHPGDITVEEAEKKVKDVESSAAWPAIQKAVVEYRKVMRSIPETLYRENLITKQYRDFLLHLHENYHPTLYAKYLDRKFSAGIKGGRKVSVYESGMHELSEGSKKAAVVDSKFLLERSLAVTYNRIYKNRANIELYKVVKDNPGTLGIRIEKPTGADKYGNNVFRDKIPDDHTRIYTFVNGKRRAMLMPDVIANGWMLHDPQMNSAMARAMRWISLTPLVKIGATGINLSFALRNIPRDLAYVWLANHDAYSNFGVIALGQIGRDFQRVASDVFTNGQRVQDYIEQGGGMEFLATQGMLHKFGEKAGKLSMAIDRTQEVLGWFNNKTELWTRIALRERFIRNGMSAEEATYRARTNLDFAQGGSLAKAMDSFIPYFNASIQGTRGVLRAFKQDPKLATLKAVQIIVMQAMLSYFNRLRDPEHEDSVSDHDKINNWTINLPVRYKDKKTGVTKYKYISIAKDQGQRGFAAIGQMVADIMHDRKPDLTMLLKAVVDIIPIVPTNLIFPSVEAAVAYVANYDIYRQREIYKGRTPIEPYAEKTMQGEFFNKIGELTKDMPVKISPVRAQRAAQKIFPINTLSNAAGFAFESVLEMMNDESREAVEKTLWEKMENVPVFKQVVRTTWPQNRDEMEMFKELKVHGVSFHDENGRPYTYKELEKKLEKIVVMGNTAKQANDYNLDEIIGKYDITNDEERSKAINEATRLVFENVKRGMPKEGSRILQRLAGKYKTLKINEAMRKTFENMIKADDKNKEDGKILINEPIKTR